LGIAGTRKLHDVFVDRKAPRESRTRWPLVVANDEIVWVPGLVRSRIAAVTARSEKVLYLRARPLGSGRNPSLLVN
jgi:tRNA(Ile)-lysidine synthase